MSWKAMSDRKKGDKAKNREIQYKEQRPQAWCGNSIVDEYWKQKDKEHREKQSS
jgi:hypothetical protein